jgi:hypothetical protein
MTHAFKVTEFLTTLMTWRGIAMEACDLINDLRTATREASEEKTKYETLNVRLQQQINGVEKASKTLAELHQQQREDFARQTNTIADHNDLHKLELEKARIEGKLEHLKQTGTVLRHPHKQSSQLDCEPDSATRLDNSRPAETPRPRSAITGSKRKDSDNLSRGSNRRKGHERSSRPSNLNWGTLFRSTSSPSEEQSQDVESPSQQRNSARSSIPVVPNYLHLYNAIQFAADWAEAKLDIFTREFNQIAKLTDIEESDLRRKAFDQNANGPSNRIQPTPTYCLLSKARNLFATFEDGVYERAKCVGCTQKNYVPLFVHLRYADGIIDPSVRQSNGKAVGGFPDTYIKPLANEGGVRWILGERV